MSRRAYVLRRIAFGLLTVWVALTLNFGLFRLAPGDPTTRFARVQGTGENAREAIRREFGLDKSLPAQYGTYLEQLARGNLGVSYANAQPVTENLVRALANTVVLVGLATVVSIVVGVGTGVLAAWRRRTWIDQATVGSSLLLYSLPIQWVGLMAIILLGGTFPVGGRADPFLIDPSFWERTLDLAWHMALPASVMAIAWFGSFTLVMRSSMLEALGDDYVLTARAKGLSDGQVVRRHVLPNALVPVVSWIALSLAFIVGGSLLVETVFSWPGVGYAFYDAVQKQDYPMLQGAFLLVTVSVIACNVLADLVAFKLDPRITA